MVFGQMSKLVSQLSWKKVLTDYITQSSAARALNELRFVL